MLRTIPIIVFQELQHALLRDHTEQILQLLLNWMIDFVKSPFNHLYKYIHPRMRVQINVSFQQRVAIRTLWMLRDHFYEPINWYVSTRNSMVITMSVWLYKKSVLSWCGIFMCIAFSFFQCNLELWSLIFYDKTVLRVDLCYLLNYLYFSNEGVFIFINPLQISNCLPKIF